mgnify:CR=1 FL=1
MLNLLGLTIVAAAIAASSAVAKSVERAPARACAACTQDDQISAFAPEAPSPRAGSRGGWRVPAIAVRTPQRCFVAATVAFAVAGVIVSQVYRLFLLRPLIDMVAAVPGSAGDMLVLVLAGGPMDPADRSRRARRR